MGVSVGAGGCVSSGTGVAVGVGASVGKGVAVGDDVAVGDSVAVAGKVASGGVVPTASASWATAPLGRSKDAGAPQAARPSKTSPSSAKSLNLIDQSSPCHLCISVSNGRRLGAWLQRPGEAEPPA